MEDKINLLEFLGLILIILSLILMITIVISIDYSDYFTLFYSIGVLSFSILNIMFGFRLLSGEF